ncbi:MAG: branched-chain amino acid ABC transporter substrate-binding protein [Alphaproteobacteria bacterium]|nr:branched-chain amino acid ABC transporter substrate-binding protein [Alphaproteobacteria bacterium]
MRALACFFISLFLGMATAHAGEIRLGVVGPMTGGSAAFGEQIKRGAQLAVDDINAQGGLLGQKIELYVQDDACDPKQARNVAAKMVNEKIGVVFGHWCTAASMAASEVYGEEGVLHMEVGALASELTQRGIPTVFRVSATDKAFARAIGRYVVQHNPQGKIAVVTDKPAVTKALTKYMQEFLATTPNKVVTVEEISGGDKDFSSIIDRLKNLKPDAIICSCYTLEAGLLARQLHEKGLNVFYYGWDTFNSPDFLNIVGKDNTGKIISVDYAHPPQSTLYQQFYKEMKKRNWPIETQTALTYAAVKIYADAVKATNSFEVPKIAEILRSQSFKTVLGDVRFEKNGDRINPAFSTYQWVDGTLKETGRIVQ